MNRFFRRLPLPVKLLLIGLVPLFFLVYLSAQYYKEKTRAINLLESYLNRVHQSINISRLIDELQTERRYSYAYAMEKKNRRELVLQRPRTDAAIRRLESDSSEGLSRFPGYTFLDRLAETRSKVDNGTTNADAVMMYYTNAIVRLNLLNVVTGGNNPYLKPVYTDLASEQVLSQMSTFLGIIRANMYNALYRRTYMVETLIGTAGVYQMYHSFESEFKIKASPYTLQAYKNIRNHSSLKPTMEYIDTVFNRMSFDSSYTAEQWQKVSMEGANELRILQQRILSKIERAINLIYEREQAKKTRTLVILVFALLFAFSIVAYTIYNISRMLNEIKAGARKISRGATDLTFNFESNDAISSLAESIQLIDQNNKVLAEAADAIGKGDFNVSLKPRSSEDLLGNALVRMKDNLQLSIKETEESREQFRQLADFMPQIVWTARADGLIDYFNKQWYSFTGFEPGHGSAKTISIVHPDDLARATSEWRHSVEYGTSFGLEYRFYDKNSGEYRWFLVRSVPVRDKDGHILKWFGTCTDIHEGKTMNERLESLVKQRTKELERSNDDLQQFAHVASHDLREPLRKIMMFSNRLEADFSSEIPERGKTYMEKIQTAAKRMASMVEGVLNYSLASSTNPHFEVIDLNTVVEGVKQDLELVIQQKSADLTYDHLPVIKGIPILIYQLFYNLVNNALKFSKEGEINHITISVRKVKSDDLEMVTDKKAKEYFLIEVADTGIGFDPSQAEKLFQIFTRLNPRDQYEGTGLGLALSKKIVLRHNGFITATGKENIGATFTIGLPVV